MDRIAIGIIRRAHGVQGEASVEPWTDSVERFSELATVTLVSPDEAHTREVAIERTRAHGERALVKFSGIETPEDVQALRNWTVEIPESEARALDDDEYFLHDLVGLRLIDAAGTDRGTVTDVIEGGGGLLLTVRRPDGRSFEMPFATEFCKEIDVEAKQMKVDLPQGLDDLDAIDE